MYFECNCCNNWNLKQRIPAHIFDCLCSIPTEIGHCQSLYRLSLMDNRISGEIPREIGFLNNLSFLDLSRNCLSGSVLAEIGNCTELQLLNLSNNTLRGSISSILGNCSSLQLLDLSRNNLSGTIPVELFKIEAPETALNLSFNHLSGVIPPQVSALKNLAVLDISHNKLEGELAVLSELENLVSLNVSYNNFTGYLPDNKIFGQLSEADLEWNEGLRYKDHNSSCFLSNATTIAKQNSSTSRSSYRFEPGIDFFYFSTTDSALPIFSSFAVFRARKMIRRAVDWRGRDSQLKAGQENLTFYLKIHDR